MLNFWRRHVIAIRDVCSQLTQGDYFAVYLCVGHNRVEMALKKLAGVLEVLFGVGFGGGDVGKCFVEEGDDAVLFV